MLKIETRALTEEERELVLDASKPPSLGCVSYIAFYGSFIILIPICGGGLVGSILMAFSIPQSWAYGIGLLTSSIASSFLFARIYLEERQRREQAKVRAEKSLGKSEAEIITLAPTFRVWGIDGLEDFGPGYLLQCNDEEYLYVASQDFMNDGIENETDGFPFPGTNLTVVRIPELDFVLGVTIEGSPTKLEPLSIPFESLDLDLTAGCAFFDKAQVEPILAKARAISGS